MQACVRSHACKPLVSASTHLRAMPSAVPRHSHLHTAGVTALFEPHTPTRTPKHTPSLLACERSAHPARTPLRARTCAAPLHAWSARDRTAHCAGRRPACSCATARGSPRARPLLRPRPRTAPPLHLQRTSTSPFGAPLHSSVRAARAVGHQGAFRPGSSWRAAPAAACVCHDLFGKTELLVVVQPPVHPAGHVRQSCASGTFWLAVHFLAAHACCLSLALQQPMRLQVTGGSSMHHLHSLEI